MTSGADHTDHAVLGWLLEADPSLRWQVQRDLLGADEEVWRETRARVATEGFGARLLSHQDADGQWAGGAYFPADVVAAEKAGRPLAEEGQPWTATTWSLSALREWGVEPSALLPDTAGLLARHARWEYDDLPYWGGEVDVCINAWTLANGAWLGADVAGLGTWFVEQQLADGGWNCAWVDGATRSSVHSTLNAVVGLLDHEVRTGGTPALTAARHRGQEHLLERGLLRRLSTDDLIGPWVFDLAYPFRWRHTALRAADHLRAAALHDGVLPDPRAGEAVESVRKARHDDGTWHASTTFPGRTWFAVDAGVGEPSRWLTFTALRMLRWWDARGGSA